MATNLKVQSFRANDLSKDTGKQFELGRAWCVDFFQIDDSIREYTVDLIFKPLVPNHLSFQDKVIKLKLAEVTRRGDRKAYANGDMGQSQIKEFFIYKLGLNDSNLEDYFAIYKTPFNEYFLYYVPKLLYSNFIQLFKSTIQEVSVERVNRNSTLNNHYPLQCIFYGAPGTGKSNAIKKEVDANNLPNVRTTFHPDSDYSTFVGAYKPTTTEVPKTTVLGTRQVPVENGKPESKIVYEFVPQAFLKAYTGAWKNQNEPFYLIIEEINRGNCAQIFGDLFQLLDRNEDGESEYPISPDEDIMRFLQTDKKYGFAALDEEQKAAIPETVLTGKELKLPKNLHIWATMNTSDQSLFPIDSAFKRRWDWQYMPIANGNKGWKIEAAGNYYDWWQFLEKINEQIGNTTNSEDKKLGYYFCKSKDGIIKAETFVGKVIFYLWNDVFKDFAEEAGGLFVDSDGKVLSFSKFYTTSSDGHAIVKEDKVVLFLHNLGLDTIGADDVVDMENNEGDGSSERKESLISINIPGNPVILTSESTHFDSFLKALKIIGTDRILTVVDSLKYKRLNCPVISTVKYPEIEHNDKGYSYYQVGNLYVVKGCKTYTYIRILEDLNQLLRIGLSLETR